MVSVYKTLNPKPLTLNSKPYQQPPTTLYYALSTHY